MLQLNQEMLDTRVSNLVRTCSGSIRGPITKIDDVKQYVQDTDAKTGEPALRKDGEPKMVPVYEFGPILTKFELDFNNVLFREILDLACNTLKIEIFNPTRKRGENACKEIDGNKYSVRTLIDSARVAKTDYEKFLTSSTKLSNDETLAAIKMLQERIDNSKK